eukprot:jgi/Orpsp1_1/1180627/evm.model.c7180000074146.1
MKLKIPSIPVNSNGKLDKSSLPEPTIENLIKEDYIAPRNDVEKIICKIYSEIFNIDIAKIGIMSDFYELGGDSFTAIKVIYEIKKQLNVNILVKNIMYNPIIKDLANDIMSNKNKNAIFIEKKNEKEFPASSILSNSVFDANKIRLFILKLFSANMKSFFKLSDNIDIQKLEEAFNVILERHEILRANFIEKKVNGKRKMYLKVRENRKIKIEHYTVDNFSKFTRKFNIKKDLLIRVGIIDQYQLLVIDIDHRISDGYSLGIIFNELNSIYYNKKLEALPIQYSDYAIYYDQILNSDILLDQLDYYEFLFSDSYGKKVNMVTKFNSNKSKRKLKIIHINSDSKFHDKVDKISKQFELSKISILLTVYCIILSLYCGNDNILIGLISSNRNNYYTQNLIGLFARFIPVLVKREDLSLVDLIRKVMDILLTITSYNLPYSKISKKFDLPICNSWFKFDPYEMTKNDVK